MNSRSIPALSFWSEAIESSPTIPTRHHGVPTTSPSLSFWSEAIESPPTIPARTTKPQPPRPNPASAFDPNGVDTVQARGWAAGPTPGKPRPTPHNPVRVAHTLAILLLLALPSLADSDYSARLQTATTTYDLPAAQTLLDELRPLAQSDDPAVTRLFIETALLVAELNRIEWELLPESNIAQRRPLGNAIDAPAEEALPLLDKLPADSETHRLKADLLAVMIRSDFRAKKYRKDLESNAARALELDPQNAKAHVSVAKPYVFAQPNEGGDPQKAVELLTNALELDPGLETARCLRGLAYLKAGENEKARADWQQALEKNPHCKPAQQELDKLK